MDQVDIVIVGAGIAGVSAAHALADLGTVWLLEREEQAGYHTTGRSAAVFAPAYGNAPIRKLTRASQTFYEQQAGGLASHPVLTSRGELLIARQDQRAALDRAERALAPELDALTRLDRDGALEKLPPLDPTYVAEALFDPSAADMDVAAIHQGFLNGFRKRGGRLQLDAELLALDAQGDGWLVHTKQGSIKTGLLVNAAGAWADVVAGLAGLPPIGLLPKRRTAFIFDPETSIEPSWPLFCDVDEQFYAKPCAGLMLGSPADETPQPPADVQPEEWDVALAVDRLERATTWQIKTLPRRWAGLRSFVPDQTPVVGRDLRTPSFFWLAGQGGYGIQTAPAMATLTRALITNSDLPSDLARQGFDAWDLAPGRPTLNHN